MLEVSLALTFTFLNVLLRLGLRCLDYPPLVFRYKDEDAGILARGLAAKGLLLIGLLAYFEVNPIRTQYDPGSHTGGVPQ